MSAPIDETPASGLDPETAQQITDAIQQGGAIVCYTRCWACMFGQCYDPPQRHSWVDLDDIEHARATGQPEPTGDCACSCARTEAGS